MRGGFWIQTYESRTFRLDRPDQRDVSIEDIAQSLAVTTRFNGHTLWPGNTEWGYSVAQHSVLVATIVEKIKDRYPEPTPACNLKLMGLMHDAHEAYVGDITSPLKRLLGDSWNWIERSAEEAVRQRFGLPVLPTSLDVVKDADRIALATEARDLLRSGPVGWARELPEPLEEKVEPWPPRKARDLFLNLFWMLQKERLPV